MREINVNQMINESKLTPFHWRVILLSTLIIIFDGYDLVIYGVSLPLLMKEWAIDPVTAGLIGSVALFGMMFGALIFGTISDKLEHLGVSRKRVIATCILLFSLFTVLCGFASTPVEFSIYRFIAGVGIGGVMPNVIALVSEYAPKKFKSFFVTLMFSGYAIGGMAAAFLGSILVPMYGWKIMFLIAGIPLILILPLMKVLPESIDYLVRRKQNQKVQHFLSQIVPEYKHQSSDVFVLDSSNQNAENAPIKMIFADGRAFSTVMFWCSIFMTLIMVYALGNWLPKLMIEAGYNLSKSLIFLFSLNVGGMIGSILGGYLADRYNLKYVLMVMLLIGAVSLSLLSFKFDSTVLYFLIACAGAASIGSQIMLLAYMAKFYPANIRTTGIGWGLGMGRIGAILGPILTGWLLALQLPYVYNFLALSIPAILGIITVFLIQDKLIKSDTVTVSENISTSHMSRATD
ncbi:MFS transporter [Acinetobacter silvestris]|uniref:Aromatic acid/H+ symport family MFS transporter n=1 Tax=Acinetobacter silvestris TaxID=1977882 RepID=A0A1Y3CKR5_9GAMM|nr:MFS transporter [Acinetobacter silvestris]OTG66479.1 aromatic acid/H+ symport family MFS transporter [Acinetobacter silvestris]